MPRRTRHAHHGRFVGPTGTDVANVRVVQNTPHRIAAGTLCGTLPMGEGALSASSTSRTAA